jgi:hypothetical protein
MEQLMTSRFIQGSRWLKVSLFLALAIVSVIQNRSSASYLFAAGFVCFAWGEAFTKHAPPTKLNATLGKIYHDHRDSGHRTEPVILAITFLGFILWAAGFVMQWRSWFG